ncbi:MAG: hypothetical protein PHQ21_06515 [Firmicutes bacterium]|nr:hypothetical protein [Bacillota bacterium]MDD4338010.1 hypothetical protein [Bacillota bacterium]
MATVPAHRRLGLGRVVLTEGLRRLRRMDSTKAFVGGFSCEDCYGSSLYELSFARRFKGDGYGCSLQG